MLRRKKKCGKWNSKRCTTGVRKAPRRRRSSKCDVRGIEHALDQARETAYWAKVYGGQGNHPDQGWAAKAKDRYLLAREVAREGGPSCAATAKRKFDAFRKQYPFVLRARVKDSR